MTRLQNLCIFSLPFHPAIGGLESIAMLVAMDASKAGLRVEVVTTTAAAEADDAQFPFLVTRTRSPRERLRAFKRAEAILFMNVSLHGLPVALLARRPVVLSHHGDYRAPGLRNQALGCLKRQLTRRFPNIAVSGFVAAQLPGHCVVIPNAYDDRLFVSVNQRTRRRDFVFCGRLVSDKGVDVLLEAFAEVVEESPDATLTIIGEGPERRPLEDWTRTHGLTGSAAFVGSLSGPPLASALSDHSCMVIPSLWNEPFGIVALEGIASCDTVISSYRGGLPEAVGGCGLLVEPSVTALADAMVLVVHARRAGLPLPGSPVPRCAPTISQGIPLPSYRRSICEL